MPKENRSPQEEEALKRLYESKYPSKEHAGAEAQFNQEREHRMRAEGFTGEYKPQKDVRHEFEFNEKRENGRLVETTARSKGPLRNPDEVINWRNTEKGLKADERARSKYHGSGDDAGHLISPEFGADPGDPRNLSKQNFVANEVGTFKKFENDTKATVARQQTPHELEVRVRYKPEGQGEREFSRNMTL